ncbi:CPBP family glutamic-type intramembrane protease [Mucisphaera calidilacus]|uniref:CAAX amino terminal protease self-immunity n=1 Tax=Mucisphaera calidilacus TaxID=2527982 RepID=A0A518C110_9BACT|nr:CPBP family glutamic-type intramembrane protease [Mucisphaera calidilacus]QDU72917.1 CAAX amino terminal protease self- immunity [Mucisphaera calidilacus]
MNQAPDDQRESWLGRLDAWVEESPWHPRVLPFFVYIFGLLIIGLGSTVESWGAGIGVVAAVGRGWQSAPVQLVLYAAQCGLVCWLLWRYRRLTPELTIRFHWLAIPTGVFLLVAWVGLGWLMTGEFSERWSGLMAGEPVGAIDYGIDGAEPNAFATVEEHDLRKQVHSDGLEGQFGAALLFFRLLGMSLVVPLFEELFIRSAMVRGLQHRRETLRGIGQVLCDFPVVGDALMNTKFGREVSREDPILTRQLVATPVGAMTLWAVFASTLVFSLSHLLRDWPGCIACGIVWCWLVWYTNRPSLAEDRRMGIGPIAWSHGITNALLWGYTVWTDDWQFL